MAGRRAGAGAGARAGPLQDQQARLPEVEGRVRDGPLVEEEVPKDLEGVAVEPESETASLSATLTVKSDTYPWSEFRRTPRTF